MITGWVLWIAVVVNGQTEEALPDVYKSRQDCVAAQQQYKGVVQDSACYFGTVKRNK